MQFRILIIALFGIGILNFAVNAQFRAAQPELLDDNNQFVVTFHRPILTAQKTLSPIAGTNTVRVDKALSNEEIKKGFKVNDRIVIRIKAPVDSYVYVVNNSKWDGSVLTNKGTFLKQGAERDFVYRLTNTQGNQSTGLEELSFLIRRRAFTDAEMSSYLTQTGTSIPKVKLAPVTEATKTLISEFKGRSSKGGIIRVGCGVASIFFPWVGAICTSTGFAAAEPEFLSGGATALSPENDATNMVVHFSFPVTP